MKNKEEMVKTEEKGAVYCHHTVCCPATEGLVVSFVSMVANSLLPVAWLVSLVRMSLLAKSSFGGGEMTLRVKFPEIGFLSFLEALTARDTEETEGGIETDAE